ncbi:MAG: universal stress protein [Bacteroidales bacterium]|nr:universal stress protein [Bacteroidales bacterium]
MKTKKIEKVLIALDYDPTAQKVAEKGYLLAKSLGAEITLLHVISEVAYYSSTYYSPIMGYTGYMDLGPIELESIETLKKTSIHFLEKSREHLGDKSIQLLVTEGDYADSIVNTAKEIQADIIVLGSHSRRWLEEILVGSVTEKVLHQSPVPLYIVPTKKQ